MQALEGESTHSRTLSAQGPSKQDLQPLSSFTVVTALVLNNWSEWSLCWLGFRNVDRFSQTAPVKGCSREKRWLQPTGINSATFPCWHERRMWNAAGFPFLAVQHFGLVLQYIHFWMVLSRWSQNHVAFSRGFCNLFLVLWPMLDSMEYCSQPDEGFGMLRIIHHKQNWYRAVC